MKQKQTLKFSALVALLMLTSVLGLRLTAAPSGPLTATVSVINNLCSGSGNAEIHVHASGGTAPYQYSLNYIGNYTTGFSPVDSFTGLYARQYVVTVADANGSYSDSVTITDPLPITLTATLTNATGGLNNGAIALHVSGGTPPYTYTWYNGDSTATVTGLAPFQSYAGNVYDTLGCQNGFGYYHIDTGSSAVRYAISYANRNNNNCYPNQSMNVSLTGSGGTAPYMFSIDGGTYSTYGGFNNVRGAIHTFSIMDANNNVYTHTDTFSNVIASAPLAIHIVTTGYGGSNYGTATITATGGVPPYTISGAGTNFSPGYYPARVQDATGYYCSIYTSFAINDTTQYTPITASLTASSYAVCLAQGYTTATAYVNIAGGYLPYRAKVDTKPYGMLSSHTWGFNYLDTGAHTIYIKDALDSVFTLPLYIASDYFNVTGTVINATGGLNNGIVLTNIIPGVAPYHFMWSDGTTNPNDSNLAGGGNYVSLTATDTLGCTAYVGFIVDSGRLTATSTVQQPTACQTGQITVSGANGLYPYRDQFGNQLQPDITYYNLAPGIYTYLVIDAANDTVVIQDTIGSAPAHLLATYTTTMGGPNSMGSVTAHVTGGTQPYIYTWSFNSHLNQSHVDSVVAGNYYLRVTDSTGCQYSVYNIIVTDTSTTPLTATLQGYQPSPCSGGSDGAIDISLSGGTAPYIYTIGTSLDTSYNDGFSYYNLTAGVYTIVVRDAVGDTFHTVLSLIPTHQDPPITIIGTVTNATGGLNNGAIVVHASGGTQPFSFSWYAQTGGQYLSITADSITGYAPGVYQFSCYDSLGCGSNYYFTIDTGSSAFSATTQVYNGSCQNSGEIDVTVTGGSQPYTYQINGGGYVSSNNYYQFQNLGAGIYTVNVKDASGAILTFHDTIAPQVDHISATATVTNATGSNGNGVVVVHPTGGFGRYTCRWDFDYTYTLNHTGLYSGLYTITVYDSLGCTAIDTIIVGTGSSALTATATATDVHCHGDSTGTITVSATGANQPITYKIGSGAYTASNVFSNLTAGIYTVTAKDATGATITLTDTIHQPATALSVVGVANNPNGSQANGSITLTIAGGTAPYTAHWGDILTNPTVRTSLHGGYYAVAVTDAVGCATGAAFYLDSNVTASVVSASTYINCHGDSTGSIHIHASGGSQPYLYSINGGGYQTDSVFSHLPAGHYVITVKALGNDSFVVVENISQTATSVSMAGTVTNTPSGMSNGAISLTVSGGSQPYTYNWGGGITTQNRTALGVGAYTVTVTDSLGCTKTATYNIIPNGINDPGLDVIGMSLYPNPTTGEVTLSMNSAYGLVTIDLYNSIGQLVQTKSVTANGKLHTTLNLTQLPDGIYEVVVKENSAIARGTILFTATH